MGLSAMESRFVRKLYLILAQEDVALVRWSADGRAFTIMDTAGFQRAIKSKHHLSSLCTFRQNLRAHAFVELADEDANETSGAVDSRIRAGAARDEDIPPPETYYHPFFVRGHPELLERIVFDPAIKYRCQECKRRVSENGAKCSFRRRDSMSTASQSLSVPSFPASVSTPVATPAAVAVLSAPAASDIAVSAAKDSHVATTQATKGTKRTNHPTEPTTAAKVAKSAQRVTATTATVDASTVATSVSENRSLVVKLAPPSGPSARVSSKPNALVKAVEQPDDRVVPSHSILSATQLSKLSAEDMFRRRSVSMSGSDSDTSSDSDMGGQPSGGLSRRTEFGRDDTRVRVDGAVVGRTTYRSGVKTTTATATTTPTGPNFASASALAFESNAKASTPGQGSLMVRVSFGRKDNSDKSRGVALSSGVTRASDSAERAVQQLPVGPSTLEASANQPDDKVIAAVIGVSSVDHLQQQHHQEHHHDRHRPLAPAVDSHRSHNERASSTVTSTWFPRGVGIMHPRDVDDEPMANSSEVSASGSEHRVFHSPDGEVQHQPQHQQSLSHNHHQQEPPHRPHQSSHSTPDADSQQRLQPQQPDELQFLHHDLQRRLQLQQQQHQLQLQLQELQLLLNQPPVRYSELQSPPPPITAPPHRSTWQPSLPPYPAQLIVERDVSEVSSQPRTEANEPPSAGVATSGSSTKSASGKRRAVKKSSDGAVPKKRLPIARSATAAPSASPVATSELEARSSKSSSLSVSSQGRRESEEVPASARTTTATTKRTKKSVSATSSQCTSIGAVSERASVGPGLERERPVAVRLTIPRKYAAAEESKLAVGLATQSSGSSDRVSTAAAVRRLANLSVMPSLQPPMRVTLRLHRDSSCWMRDAGTRASSATKTAPVSSEVVSSEVVSSEVAGPVPALGSSSRSHGSVATSRVGSASRFGPSSALPQGSEAAVRSSSVIGGGALSRRHSSDAREKKTNASRSFRDGDSGISQTLSMTKTTTKATMAKAVDSDRATSGHSDAIEHAMVVAQRMYASMSASSAAAGGGVGGSSSSPAVTAVALTTVSSASAASSATPGAGVATVAGAGSVSGGSGLKRSSAGSTAKPRGGKKRPSGGGAPATSATTATAAIAAPPAPDVQAAPGSQGSQTAAATSTKIRATSLKRARDEESLLSTGTSIIATSSSTPALHSSSASAASATLPTQLSTSLEVRIPKAQRPRASMGVGIAPSTSSSGNRTLRAQVVMSSKASGATGSVGAEGTGLSLLVLASAKRNQ